MEQHEERSAVGESVGTLDVVRSRLTPTEAEMWLANQRSAKTRAAYKADIEHFMRSLGIASHEELSAVDRAMVIAWRRLMECDGVRPRTIMRRMASLSSLCNHFVEQGILTLNPVGSVKRPRVEQKRGVTPAFCAEEAAQLLSLPDERTVQGLRDRAILSVLLQAGLRRSEVAGLLVKNFFREAGFDMLRFMKKGNLDHQVALHPQTAARIRDYLCAAGHGEDVEGALFRPVKGGHWRKSDTRRGLSADAINRIVKKYAAGIGLERGYSAHSCRSTFITHALKAGAKLEHVQQTVGHAYPSTTQGYDRNRFDPEQSATFFANFS